MKDEDKTKSQLIAELKEMRKRVADLTHPLKDVEREQTEASLRLAKVIFDKAPIGIWITGLEWMKKPSNRYLIHFSRPSRKAWELGWV